jgi:hypothetical protein
MQLIVSEFNRASTHHKKNKFATIELEGAKRVFFLHLLKHPVQNDTLALFWTVSSLIVPNHHIVPGNPTLEKT